MGVEVPLRTQDRLQIEQQLPLQSFLPLPGQLHPPQLPTLPPGDGQGNPGGQAALFRPPDGPCAVKGPAVGHPALVQRGGGQAHQPLRPVEEDGHPSGGVVLPRPCQGDGVLPGPGAGQAVVAGQQAVAAVRQQVALGPPPAEGIPLPGQRGAGGGPEFGGKIPLLLLHDGRSHRYPLLEQLPVGGHVAVLHKPLLHHVVPQDVVNGCQAHPQVVGHIGADHLPLLSPGQAGGRVVHRLIQAVAALQPHIPQAAQVAQGAAGRQQQGQEGGVGGHHQLGVQPPLQPQGLDPVRLILVAHAGVKGVKAGFGDSPGPLCLIPPALLGVDAEGEGLVEEGVGLAGQEQIGHEVLKHGARPGGHAAVVVVSQEHSAQPPPVAGGNLPSGHRDKAGLSGLAGHQVIKAVCKPVPLHLIADGKQPPLPVEERGAVHGVRQRLGPSGQHILPPLVQPLPQSDETAPQVAAVHGGHIPGLERLCRGGVIPVVQVSLPLVQLFHGIQDMGYQLHRPLPGGEVQVGRRHSGQQGHADVGGGGPPGQGGAGLLLPVVRGEVVVLLPEEGVEIPPDQGGLVKQEGPVGRGQGPPPAGGPAHRPGQRGGQQPHQPHRFAKPELGKQDHKSAHRR